MRTNEPTSGDLWVGVDVGTQSLRVLLVDESGTVVARGAGRLTSHRWGVRHEQDPAQWWRVFGEVCRRVLAGHRADRLRGLAICGTSGTFLLAGRSGEPRTRALMYDDGRAGAEVEEVATAGAQLWASLGYAMQRSWALPKLLWLRRHGPDDLRADLEGGRVELLHCADYLARRLTGGPVATDWSHALKTGYDLDSNSWPVTVLDKLGLPVDVLPPVVRPGTQIGRVDAAGAAHSGLPIGLPVRAGMTDGCAAQIAAGTLTAGSWNSVLGTTLVLKGVSVERLADPHGAVYSHRHPDSGWLPGGASNVGAGVLEAWFPHTDRTELDHAAARYEPASGLAYPLVTRGERFPFVRPEAESFELGTFSTEAERYAAVLQGVAFVERLCYASLRRLGARTDGPLALTGGATRSRYWCQLRADVLGREVVLPGSPEPAFGMAVLAAAGDGPVTEAARRLVRVAHVVSPRPGATARFAAPYARFIDALADRGYVDDDLAAFAKGEL
jgi:sugar (pentulose or hexulose) kinase